LSERGGTVATEKFEHVTFYLTKKQVEKIKVLAEDQQISRSALVRIIITDYLSKNAKTKIR